MFENPRKGWHGAYSLSGKITAEHFDEILRKEKIFNLEKEKKLIIKDFLAPDEEKINLDFLYDDIKSFQVYQNEKKHFSESLLKASIEKNNNKIALNKHKEISKTYYNKPKNKNIYLAQDKEYEPKYDLVFSKTLTGINWNKMTGRKKPKINSINNNIHKNHFCKKYDKEEGENNTKNYLTHESKCLVDMNKYTKRGEFIELKDIRKRYDKPFQKNFHTIKKCSESSSLNHEYKIKRESKLNNNKKLEQNLKQSFSEKIIVPDFKKYLSRKYVDKIMKQKGIAKNNFLLSLSINYDLIKEKNVNNIKFNNKKNKKSFNEFKGIESTYFTDCYKYIDKLNNHSETKVPKIKLMSPRYSNSNKKINYEKANDYLRPAFSSFYKNSFNNLINLKLMDSIFFHQKRNNKIKSSLKNIKNNMTFNEKTYKQLIKENNINKVDGITLKTFKRNHKDNK